jgi:hypothetical protein
MEISEIRINELGIGPDITVIRGITILVDVTISDYRRTAGYINFFIGITP